MKVVIHRRRCYFAVVLLLGIGLFAQAAEPDARDIVKYRQSIMKSQREHMAAATAIIQGKVDYPEQLAGHVHALAATTQMIASLFPKGSDGGETRALASV